MAVSIEANAKPSGRRETRKQEIIARVNETLLRLISEGADINHDVVAEGADISRRTLYRYFPDRDAMFESLWEHVALVAGESFRLPTTESELVSGAVGIHETFDRMAPLITVITATSQGRSIRLASRKRRKEKYETALQGAVAGLPEKDRNLAIAVIQLLHTASWLEMRDQWNLSGKQSGRAVTWAIRTLLADLHARSGEPLDAAVQVLGTVVED